MRKWLLVDDDADDVEVFEIALQETDKYINLLTARNGGEAMDLLLNAGSDELPELIFMDINMPQMDGKRCLVEIRRHEDLNKLPVIMYSTTVDEKDIDECLKLGADDFVSKPTDITDLIGILKKFANN